ncbi:endonuclease/exonuclease/phosphatase family protein [Nonomuraea rhodomycinica]|uniref:Endonuclease/exonuclease/phosphatase family protein n=1 Tax=Nonomuraea rhodomycinica TaxID=1712872 RepID=A0A7Y6MDP7_9ACTN|nr:endonuclease/exonuclease/phosphatase family protein [Nonomuraea rhodomycinica]NUW44132.1 endonuclease/exonuclease/phosphatase family protein [Nonomuraea rhodomycinica]
MSPWVKAGIEVSSTSGRRQEAGDRSGAAPRRRRWPSWTVAGCFAVWALERLAGAEQGSFDIQLMTLTPYAVVVTALLTVLFLFRNRRAALVTAVSCATLAATVVPRAVPPTAPVPVAASGPVLRVLTINLFGRADAGAVVRLVRAYDPDVFSALELTYREAAALDAAGLGALLPYQVLQADLGSTGSGLYGKHPLTELTGLFTAIGHHMPAATITLPGGTTAQVVAVHPNPPLGRRAEEWDASLDALPPPSPRVTRVLAGDFNASLDHRAFRDLLARGYVDAAEETGKGLVPTWPNGRAVPPFITIDHVLVDRRAAVARTEIVDVPGTDHRGVFAELRLPPAA